MNDKTFQFGHFLFFLERSFQIVPKPRGEQEGNHEIKTTKARMLQINNNYEKKRVTKILSNNPEKCKKMTKNHKKYLKKHLNMGKKKIRLGQLGGRELKG